MTMFKKLALIAVAGLILAACKEKKKPSLSGEEPVAIDDFIRAFELVKPTYEIADSILFRKEPDSLQISYKIFTQFIPDSVPAKDFGKKIKPKFYMLKRVAVEKRETYLFVKAIQADKKLVYIICFDKENNFTKAMPLLKDDGKSSTKQVAGIDNKYSIFRNTSQKMNDGSMAEGKEVYVYNADAKQFMLIMTDALDDRVKEVINPIDTMNRKHKFSADYVKDKMNIVSIRDAANPGKLNFFIHFDRTGGECTGELKGLATLIKSNVAEYRQPGDICILQFTFTSSTVSVKELGPCGTHRGVKCSFDGNYPRRKITNKKTVKD
ncbi:MAG TPA: hypothetical protein VI548_02020 [Chitinophagaceae bacterium]|nr:hypothetical protein [Chitinophagaceae bacterium]